MNACEKYFVECFIRKQFHGKFKSNSSEKNIYKFLTELAKNMRRANCKVRQGFWIWKSYTKWIILCWSLLESCLDEKWFQRGSCFAPVYGEGGLSLKTFFDSFVVEGWLRYANQIAVSMLRKYEDLNDKLGEYSVGLWKERSERDRSWNSFQCSFNIDVSKILETLFINSKWFLHSINRRIHINLISFVPVGKRS